MAVVACCVHNLQSSWDDNPSNRRISHYTNLIKATTSALKTETSQFIATPNIREMGEALTGHNGTPNESCQNFSKS